MSWFPHLAVRAGVPAGPRAPDAGLARVRRLARTTARMTALAGGARCSVPGWRSWRRCSGRAASGASRRPGPGWLLAAAGVRVVATGPRPAPGSLVVANHVSWLDVLALNRIVTVRMLAKAEVRDWPLVGPMAARAGTVFLDRDRLRALPAAVAEVADALRDGACIGVFRRAPPGADATSAASVPPPSRPRWTRGRGWCRSRCPTPTPPTRPTPPRRSSGTTPCWRR